MKTDAIHRVKFSTRGRLTIPAPFRKQYGIKGGARMRIEVTPSGALLLKPIVATER
jgi:AbrB family looped-hinge helix DNA binding protein